MKKGIDVAKWNGTIKWYRVAKADVDFTIIKIINKKLQPDGQFLNNLSGCIAAGIPWGVYHYTYAKTVAEAQQAANVIVALLGKFKPDKKVWLDVEDEVMKNRGEYLMEIIEAYREIIEGAGFEFGIYTGEYFYNQYIRPYCKRKYSLWIAKYPYSDAFVTLKDDLPQKRPNIGTDYEYWQYSSKGRVDGIEGNVDLNVQMKEENCYLQAVMHGDSLVKALEEVGVDSSFDFRKKIAAANGIDNYMGTVAQNMELFVLLRAGRLRKGE